MMLNKHASGHLMASVNQWEMKQNSIVFLKLVAILTHLYIDVSCNEVNIQKRTINKNYNNKIVAAILCSL